MLQFVELYNSEAFLKSVNFNIGLLDRDQPITGHLSSHLFRLMSDNLSNSTSHLIKTSIL